MLPQRATFIVLSRLRSAPAIHPTREVARAWWQCLPGVCQNTTMSNNGAHGRVRERPDARDLRGGPCGRGRAARARWTRAAAAAVSCACWCACGW
eukprot:6085149-Prymnesium_polylepis.1